MEKHVKIRFALVQNATEEDGNPIPFAYFEDWQSAQDVLHQLSHWRQVSNLRLCRVVRPSGRSTEMSFDFWDTVKKSDLLELPERIGDWALAFKSKERPWETIASIDSEEDLEYAINSVNAGKHGSWENQFAIISRLGSDGVHQIGDVIYEKSDDVSMRGTNFDPAQ